VNNVETLSWIYLDASIQKKKGLKFEPKKHRSVLDRDHFGIKEVEEKIIEHLAVLKEGV